MTENNQALSTGEFVKNIQDKKEEDALKEETSKKVRITKLSEISLEKKKKSPFHDLGDIVSGIHLCSEFYKKDERNILFVNQANKLQKDFENNRELIVKNQDEENEPVLIKKMVEDMTEDNNILKELFDNNQLFSSVEGVKELFKKSLSSLDQQIEEMPEFIDINEYQVNKKNVNLNNFIPDILDVIKKDLSERQDHIKFIRSTEAINCHLDSRLTQKTLENFIHNSIKYSPKNSNIFVFFTEKNGEVTISVKDFGIGLKPKELDSLEKLEPGEGTRFSSDKAHGTGFGFYNAILL
jgi:signal transduction histidine kinase